MASKAQVGIIIKVTDQTSRQLNAITSATKKMTGGFKSAGNSMKAFGAKSRQVGGSLTKSLTLPILAIGGAMVKTFADFDATMTNIEARTGSTAEQMERIRKVAIRMGRDTAFSANQAGDAMLELMSSGSSVEEAISTLPRVLDLAAAGQLELGRASDIVTDILAQFGENVEQAERVVNALAAGAQSSSADVESLAQGFANVGPLAKNFGISLEETTAILAVFAENGIKGAQAGTQLKSMLTAMTSQTARTQGAWERMGISMFDAAGNVRNIDVIIDDLNAALSGLTEQERIATIQDLAGSFGQMGLSALLASGGTDKMMASMSASQTASQVAKKQMESFNGAVNQLSGSLQTMAIVVIGPFVENTLQPMIEGVTKALNVFTDWAAKNEEIATLIVGVVAAIALIGPALFIIGAASSVFGTMLSGFSAVSTAVSFLATAIPSLATAMTTTLIPSMISATTTASAMAVSFAAAAAPLLPLIAAVGLLILTIDQFGEAALNTIKTIGMIFEFIAKKIGSVFPQLIRGMGQIGIEIIKGLAQGLIDGAKFVIQAISNVGNSVVGAIKGIFGIRSPSKIMMEIGANVVLGFNKGVDQTMSAATARSAPTTVANSIVPRIAPLLAAAGGGGGGLQPSFAGAGRGDVNITIKELIVPAGTPQEAVEFIWEELGQRLKKLGVTGGGIVAR